MDIWIFGGFLSHGGTPSHHPFLFWDFPLFINHPAKKGILQLWKPPYDMYIYIYIYSTI